MKRALDMFIVEGIHTSIPLHKRILQSKTLLMASSIRSLWSGSCRKRGRSASFFGPGPPVRTAMKIPALYPILDADAFGADCVGRELLLSVCANAMALADAGCTVLQYRAKRLSARELFPSDVNCAVCFPRLRSS